MTPSIKIDKKAGTITIVMPLEKPKLSASGKSYGIASTRGNKPAEGDKYEGHTLTVGLNVYYPKD